MPCIHAVAEAQQLAPDVFAETSQLQQPGRQQQQVHVWSDFLVNNLILTAAAPVS